MIVAALLHDIGHLLHDFDEDCAEQGIDDQHEARAEQWLATHFPAEVVQPVALHVLAKRYRCTVDRRYNDALSDASRLSLQLQGGTVSEDEAESFRAHEYFREALQLRVWDEAAKDPKLKTPSLDHYLNYIHDVL